MTGPDQGQKDQNSTAALTEDSMRTLTESSVSFPATAGRGNGPKSGEIGPESATIPPLTCDDTREHATAPHAGNILSEHAHAALTEDSVRAHRGKGKERKGKEGETNGGSAAVANPPLCGQTAKTTSTTTASRRPSSAASPLTGETKMVTPSTLLSEPRGTTKASQDDKATGPALMACLNTTPAAPAETNHQEPSPADSSLTPAPPAGPQTTTGEDPLEQLSFFDAPVVTPTVKEPKPVKEPNKFYPAAKAIMTPWWNQFEHTQMLPFARVLKTVLTALEHHISPEVISAAMDSIGRDQRPVTPGTLQMAISNLDKVSSAGMGRPVNFEPAGLTE